ncbi:SusC/RagA family TonB-linked outer membrane protein [Mucilaginibacter gotjawali]|uniref:TonB-linked SusC/RagA family outer membrane protein n=2 Tax=Mucilaginibacter gotjawali TaxID=1550579 RepID=A0A839SLR5_9SPHI|nr:TonB-dependent receptor [Mucilaginibacter gotjawali]MBB3057387.1 TonB-linked SusC/RagA family outer membrane protein [Mucilaginibacter gotjawali]BAU55494.1 TonB-dependent Receptor Plug Domain protein [Mucilaginibacter gotjawali]
MGKILRIALLFLSMVISAGVMAQNQGTVIKGTVTDNKGVTLPGATVTVKGTQTKVATDVNGKYSIVVPAGGKVLTFSFIGMDAQDVAIGAKALINVALQLSSTALSDVVVIGYGSQKKRDVNGAISSVSAKDIQDIPLPSVDQLLQGKAAGVTVTLNSGQPGSATSVHIRGITEFGSSEPLYVIDGVEVDGDAKGGYGGGAQLNSPGSSNMETTVSPLSMLNPDDIESIDILKDASASAIYGSRGSHGVILITTKRGKSGSAKVSYDGYVGMQKQGKFLDVDNLQQYAVLENKLAAIFGTTPRGEFANPSALGSGTNWQQAIFRTAMEQSHNLSVSGGSDKADYYISGGYFKQDGTILGYNFDRYSFRGVVNSQVKEWLKIGTVFGAMRSDENVGLGSNTGIIYNALLAAPDQAVYNADGSFAGPAYINGQFEGGPNPVQQALNITNTLTRSEINGNMYADIKFFKDLTLHSELDGDFNWANGQTFNPTYQYGAAGVTDINQTYHNDNATLNRAITNSTYWSWKEYFNYAHSWGKHNLTALAGREVWESNYDYLPLSGNGFPAGNNVQSIALANVVASSIGEQIGTQVMQSYIGRLIYTYNNRYSITANIRSDQSSNFNPNPNKQIGYFPGVAVSWRLSEESFMSGVKSIADNIKIRLGYGTTGNSNVPQYVYGASLKGIPTAFGAGFLINNVANPNLVWATAIQKNLGVDLTLLNRIDVTFDAYDKTAKNFLFPKPLPHYLLGGPNEYGDNPGGIAVPYINAGNIENKGFEFTINSRNIATKNFKWNTTLTFSHYSNIVTSLSGAPAITQSVGTSYVTLAATKTIVGQPEGEFFGYKVQGVVKTQAQLEYLSTHPQNVTGTSPQVVSNAQGNTIWLGDLQYADTNHDGKVDENDQVPLGNPNPDFTYGFTNNFTYKDFDLSFSFYGSYGGKILDVLEYQTAGLSSLYSNQLASTANFWTPSNPNSNIPAPRAGISNANLVMSDRFLESASFLRLQSARLGYNLPARWAKYVAMNSLKVYVTGQNLFVITKYPGLDPEVGAFNENPLLMNVDMGRYPSPRVFTLGVNAQF